MDMKLKELEFMQNAKHERMNHMMDMAQSAEEHAMKTKHIEEEADAKNKARAMAGVEKSSSNK